MLHNLYFQPKFHPCDTSDTVYAFIISSNEWINSLVRLDGLLITAIILALAIISNKLLFSLSLAVGLIGLEELKSRRLGRLHFPSLCGLAILFGELVAFEVQFTVLRLQLFLDLKLEVNFALQ